MVHGPGRNIAGKRFWKRRKSGNLVEPEKGKGIQQKHCVL